MLVLVFEVSKKLHTTLGLCDGLAIVARQPGINAEQR